MISFDNLQMMLNVTQKSAGVRPNSNCTDGTTAFDHIKCSSSSCEQFFCVSLHISTFTVNFGCRTVPGFYCTALYGLTAAPFLLSREKRFFDVKIRQIACS